MTNAHAAQLSKPYGRHAATRGTARTVPATKGPGRHAAPGGRLPLADVATIDTRPVVDRAPLLALLALVVTLAVLVGIGTTAATTASTVVDRPAAVVQFDRLPLDLPVTPADAEAGCGDYCGTDAHPAPLVEEDEPGWDCATMGNRVCDPAA